MGISLGGHEIKMGPIFDGGESKLMQMLLVILTQIVRWDGLGSVPIPSPNALIFACCPGEKHSTCHGKQPRVQRVACHLYAKACDNLPTQGVFKELFLGIRIIPDVPLPKGLFCLRSQTQHQVSVMWFQVFDVQWAPHVPCEWPGAHTERCSEGLANTILMG